MLRHDTTAKPLPWTSPSSEQTDRPALESRDVLYPLLVGSHAIYGEEGTPQAAPPPLIFTTREVSRCALASSPISVESLSLQPTSTTSSSPVGTGDDSSEGTMTPPAPQATGLLLSDTYDQQQERTSAVPTVVDDEATTAEDQTQVQHQFRLVWGLCRGALRRFRNIVLKFMTGWSWTQLGWTFMGIATFLTMATVFTFLAGNAIWGMGRSLALTDNLTNSACQWYWARPLCSYACVHWVWFSLHIFTKTCLSHRRLIAGGYLDAKLDVSGRADRTPYFVSAHLGSCSYFNAMVPTIMFNLKTGGDASINVSSALDELCSLLRNVSSEQPRYDRHVGAFQDALRQGINFTQTHLENANDSAMSNNMDLGQLVIESIPVFITRWKENFDILTKPGALLVEYTDQGQQMAGKLQHFLEKRKKQIWRERKATIKAWGLPRRLGRSIGLLRDQTEELEPYDDASEAIERILPMVVSLGEYFTLSWTNATELDRELTDLAATLFSKEVRFEHGPQGMFKVQSYINDIQHKTRAMPMIRKTLEGQPVQTATPKLD
ncbi:MAG: hypothetical protein Q9174_003311 [Haloplaca sp. 1 TL-2023]